MLFNSIVMTLLIFVILVAAGYHLFTSWEFKYCYSALEREDFFSKPNRLILNAAIQETLKDVRLYMVLGFILMLPSLIVMIFWYLIQFTLRWIANIPIYRKR